MDHCIDFLGPISLTNMHNDRLKHHHVSMVDFQEIRKVDFHAYAEMSSAWITKFMFIIGIQTPPPPTKSSVKIRRYKIYNINLCSD